MKALIEYLEVKKPASISIVTLLRRETSPLRNKPPTMLYPSRMNGWWVTGWMMKTVIQEI
jgi:hypothetical protein